MSLMLFQIKITNFMYDPLEQFSVFSFMCFFNNFIFFSVSLFGVFYFMSKASFSLQNTPLFLVVRLKLRLLVSILKMNALNIDRFIYLPVLLVLFILILFFNVSGMFPFFFTVTSLFVVTFIFPFGIWLGALILGVLEHEEKFWLLFLPPNSPAYLYAFLLLIELISYSARLFSLAVRLFANMTAGHLLLKILAGVCYQLCFISPFVLGVVPGVVVACVIVLEFVVALIQAGIFIGLSTIYINNSLALH